MSKLVIDDSVKSKQVSVSASIDKLKEGQTIKYLDRSYKAGGKPDKKGTPLTKLGKIKTITRTKAGGVKTVELAIDGMRMPTLTAGAFQKLLDAKAPAAGEKTSALRIVKGDVKAEVNKVTLKELEKKRDALAKQLSVVQKQIGKLVTAGLKAKAKPDTRPTELRTVQFVEPTKGATGWLTQKMQMGTDAAKPTIRKRFVKVVKVESNGYTFAILNEKTGRPDPKASPIFVAKSAFTGKRAKFAKDHGSLK